MNFIIDSKIKYIKKRMDFKLHSNCPRTMKIQLGYFNHQEYYAIFQGRNYGKCTLKTKKVFKDGSLESVSAICHSFGKKDLCLFKINKTIKKSKSFFSRGFIINDETLIYVQSIKFSFYVELETLDVTFCVVKERKTSTTDLQSENEESQIS